MRSSWRVAKPMLVGLVLGLSACAPPAEPIPDTLSEPDSQSVAPTPAKLPIASPSPVVAAQAPAGQNAIIALVQDGDILIWDQATGQIQRVFDAGDAIRVKLSDDGELVAFVRRAFFAAGGYDRNEQSSLWVVGRDGGSPRELVSAEQLRHQLGAAETDSVNFPRLEWVPNTHRLLYSGNTYGAHDYGEGAHTPLRGVYRVDADSGAIVVLAPADIGPAFLASPDGQQVALVTTTGLSFVNLDGNQRYQDALAYPAYGVPGAITPPGVWTQDSRAFLILSSFVQESDILLHFTIWRVPVDGSRAEPLIDLDAGTPYVLFAPDGSAVSYSRWAPATSPEVPELFGWFNAVLPESVGPVAVPADSFDRAFLTWSPGGSAYILDAQDRQQLYPLCPGALQSNEICWPSIPFVGQIEWLEWLDRTRFLYVTHQPRRLYLGSLDGPSTMIAEDPQSFSGVAATCKDNSELLSHVSVADGTDLAPQAIFTKTWRIRNRGTCQWDGSYRLTYLSGARMSGPRSVPLMEAVQPGQEVEISVTLIAPASQGTYRGQWQMFAPDGKPFGNTMQVLIGVP